MRLQPRGIIAAGIALGLVMVASPAAGKGGELSGYGDRYQVTHGWSGQTDETFIYGRPEDSVYVGNWNGVGPDTLAVRRGFTYFFKNSLAGGEADHVVKYGRDGDVVYMGDWDGDGIDTPVVRRGDRFFFKNSLSGGEADREIIYGHPDDVVVVGDWNGDGSDTLGVRRGHTYFLKNSIDGGEADVVVKYGRAGDEVLVGDWDGSGRDTLGVRRGSVFYMKDSISGGEADITMEYGRASDAPMVGDWNGNGLDTVGLRRAVSAPPGSARDAYDARMIDLINAERAAAGVAPVREWPRLRPAALQHSTWMASQGTIQHASLATIRSDARAVGCTAGGEHIVRTYQPGRSPDPRDAMDWYMASDDHRDGILNPNNTHVAVGTVQAGDLVYNTQRFVRNCS